MTQPPDERPRPDQPAGEGAPENEPTVAWTPPDPDPATPPDQGGVGYAAIPDEGAPAAAEQPPVPPAPNMPTEPPAAPPETPADASPPPPSPIISAAPTEPASGWQTPTASTPAAVPPGSGWEVPPAAAAVATTQDGYVISGVGSRIVAWLIDTTLAGIIPALISLSLIDFQGIVRNAIQQAEQNPTGRFDSTVYTIPVTLDYILITLITVGIQYLYFVGFWTSRWRATPGMMGLQMRVVDAMTGGTLSIVEATKRWIALGFPLALLALIAPLQSAAGVIQFALLIFLFFTTVTNARRQGLHDRWANSLVIRSATSGNGATVVGCLLWGVLIIVLAFVASTIVLANIWPTIQDYINTFPSPAP
ncbi:MAG: RDD family protein [Chloroflexota bacterium]